MFYYAITINKNHSWFELDMLDSSRDIDLNVGSLILNSTAKNIISDLHGIEYIDMVIHKNDLVDFHIHGLIASVNEITTLLIKGKCHLEVLMNMPKYEKYMYNHDVVLGRKFGDMPFYDSSDIKDNLYRDVLSYFFQSRSAVKTVQRYGLCALKYYSQLKSMEMDLDIII